MPFILKIKEITTKKIEIMNTLVKVSKKVFEIDLENCLTILENKGKDENYTYYKCEYISPSLYKRIVDVAVFN
jgi:hypothetical protein